MDPDAARRYDSWFDRRWGRYAWRVETDAVLRVLAPLSGRRVVDVGCGTGRLAAVLAAHGGNVIGVDIDGAMLAVAAGRLPGRLVRADATALPLPDAAVDAAVSVATLEFASDPSDVLAEMARVTRVGGQVVVVALNPHSLWGWTGRVRRRSPYRQGCLLSRGQLLALGRRHGRARVHGVLFAAERLPLLRLLGPVAETVGTVVPRLGAAQVLVVERTRP